MTPLDHAVTDVHPDIEQLHGRGVITPRKRRMVEAYVRSGTYSAAAAASGYAPTTVKELIMKDPACRKAVGQLVDQAAAVTGITLERVLEEYARLAFSDIGEFMDVMRLAKDEGESALEMLGDLPASVTAAVSKLEYAQVPVKGESGNTSYITGSLKIHLHDKKGALSDLARILSLFNDKITIEDNSTFGDRLRKVVERLEGTTDGNA